MRTLVEYWNRQLPWGWLAQCAEDAIEQAVRIQQIAAPTFAEQPRALYLVDVFRRLGLQDVSIDALHNVYGLLPGREREPGILVSAHTDTVFAQDTNLQIRREHNRIYGPGLGDNSMGVAGLLALVEGFRRLGMQPERDIWLVANTREEGLGDLGGMKAAFERLKDSVACVVNLEGMAFGHVYHAGIAVRRLHITARTEGGHSWLNFGRPSAIHAVVELGARITALQPPGAPRTTYNIGIIEGGQSINTIAAEAGFWLDMRSEDSAALMVFEHEVRALIEAARRPDVAFQIEVVGDRPAGSIPVDHPLVQGALSALEQVGVHGTLENGSTDANVPLSLGCPAVTVGITRGSNAHRLDEYIETAPVADGIHQLMLLVLAAASARDSLYV